MINLGDKDARSLRIGNSKVNSIHLGKETLAASLKFKVTNTNFDGVGTPVTMTVNGNNILGNFTDPIKQIYTISLGRKTNPEIITHEGLLITNTEQFNITFSDMGRVAGSDDIISNTIVVIKGGTFGTPNGPSQEEQLTGTFGVIWDGISDEIVIGFSKEKD